MCLQLLYRDSLWKAVNGKELYFIVLRQIVISICLRKHTCDTPHNKLNHSKCYLNKYLFGETKKGLSESMDYAFKVKNL